MVTGVSGDLLAGRLLDVLIDDATADNGPPAAWARAGVRWWQTCSRALGPAAAP